MWQFLTRGQRALAASTAAVFVLLLLLAGRPAAARANDPLETTTELGVTITAKDIFDAFHESVEFWPPVRKFIISDQFAVADAKDRAQASVFIKQVQDQLHERLFSDDQEAAADLVTYVSWGLRRARFFRELRATIDDKETLIDLRHTWLTAYREASRDAHQVNVAAVVCVIKERIEPLDLPPEAQAKVLHLWHCIGECMVHMDATEAGRIMQRADEALGQSSTGDLVRSIVAAADWAQVIKAEKTIAQRKDFAAAWDELNRTRLAQSPKSGQ